MNPIDQVEREEFLQQAARAIGQREILISLLGLPRDLDDLDLQALVARRVNAELCLIVAAQQLCESGAPVPDAGGMAYRVRANQFTALHEAAAAADSARKVGEPPVALR